MLKSIVAVVALCALAASPVLGAVLVNETFTHPDGNLVGQVPTPGPGAAWAAHSGAGSVPVQVTGGKITLAQGSGTREDVNVDAGTAIGAGGKWYAAFDLSIPSVADAITNVYFAHFLQGTSNFTSRVWITAPEGAIGSGYRLALSNGSNMTAVGVAKTGDLAFDTTYRVVTSYDFDTKTGSMWINPTTEASTSFAATDAGFANAVTAYAFRQGSGNSSQVIDNLLVGTTFGEVVPEPTTLVLLAAAGSMLWRRRR